MSTTNELYDGGENDIELETIDERLLNTKTNSSYELTIKGENKEFYAYIIVTILLYSISHIILLGSIVAATELFIAFPTPFLNFISTTFLKYHIILIILGIVRSVIGLLLLYFNIFIVIKRTIISLLIWLIYVLTNGLFGAMVSLVMVNSASNRYLARIPIYTIIGVTTIIIIIILIISIVAVILGPNNNFTLSVKRYAFRNIAIFRGVLFILSIIAIVNSLPFKKYKYVPELSILILMAIIIGFLFLVFLNETFDKDSFFLNKENRSAITMSFYLIVTSSDFIYIVTVFLPSIGVRLFTNPTIYNNIVSSGGANNTQIDINEQDQDQVEMQNNTNIQTNNRSKRLISGIRNLLF